MVALDTGTRIQTATLPAGLTLQYAEAGDPAGIPVVLLHGLSDSLHSFDAVLERVPASLHVYALTQRGHGDSDRPATGYQLDDFADDVIDFLNAVGIARAVIVGHSLGSLVARTVATRAPERVAGLVLIGAFATLTDRPEAEELAAAIASFEGSADRAFIEEFQRSCVVQPVAEEFMQQVFDESEKLPAHAWQAIITGLLDVDLRPNDARIAVPTLLAWGDGDAWVTRDDQDALLAGISGSRLSVYEGVGHTPQWETPDRLVAEIEAFATSI
jgi:pimeloyl-ACP methyl ester carboxylesterase